MGRRPSEKPAKLAKKLRALRSALGVSQAGLVERLGLEDKLTREDISKYERGLRVPALLTLLRYAKAGKVTVDALIDDEVGMGSDIVQRKRQAKAKK